MADDLDDAINLLSQGMPPPHPHAAPDQDLASAVDLLSSTPSNQPAPIHRQPVAPNRPATPNRPTPPPADMGWGDTLSHAWSALPGSALNAVTGVANAIRHPLDTLGRFGELGGGLYSKAEGALGIKKDPNSAALEQTANQVIDPIKQRYGSMAGFKHSLATDPIAPLMDAATVLTLGGGTAAKLGVEGGTLANLGTKAAAAGSALDPIQGALKIAKAPFRAVRAAQGALSGVGYDTLANTRKIGSSLDPAVHKAFIQHLTGSVPQSQIADTALDAMNQIKAQNAAKFAQTKAGIYASNPGALGFDKVDQALSDANDAVNPGGVSSPDEYLAPTKAALNTAQKLVDHWKLNPQLQTMQGFDQLRNGIGNLLDTTRDDSALQKNIGGVYHAVRGTMEDVSPEYTNTLEATTQARKNLLDLQKTLGLGKNTAQTLSVAKQLREMKKSGSSDLLSQLFAVKPELQGMLAGAAAAPWRVGGMRGMIEGIGGTGLGLQHLLFAPQHLPAVLAAGAGTALGSSPKLGGLSNYLAGLGGIPAGAALSRPVTSAAYYTGPGSSPPDQAAANDSAIPNSDGSFSSGDPDFDRILHQESRQRQFDPKTGKVITSPKGAIGAAQIMPGTGPMAAKLAGEPWSLDRLKNDVAYNIRLGHAYYKHLLDQFGGDKAKAAAAYNTGPGNVKKALDRASATGANWVTHLPFKETRDYVQNVAPEYASADTTPHFASGGKVGHEHLVQRLMKLAEDAKKQTDKATAPLLQQSDNNIANALAIAQKAI